MAAVVVGGGLFAFSTASSSSTKYLVLSLLHLYFLLLLPLHLILLPTAAAPPLLLPLPRPPLLPPLSSRSRFFSLRSPKSVIAKNSRRTQNLLASDPGSHDWGTTLALGTYSRDPALTIYLLSKLCMYCIARQMHKLKSRMDLKGTRRDGSPDACSFPETSFGAHFICIKPNLNILVQGLEWSEKMMWFWNSDAFGIECYERTVYAAHMFTCFACTRGNSKSSRASDDACLR